MKTIKQLPAVKLITCILPKGQAQEVIESLANKRGVSRANISFARGAGMAVPQGRAGIGQQIEKDILTVVVDSKESNDLFHYIFDVADINRPHGGFMFMTQEVKGTQFELPKNVDNQ